MGLKKQIVTTLIAAPNGMTGKQLCGAMGYPIERYGVVQTLISQINANLKKWNGVYISTIKVSGGDDIYKLVTKETSTVLELQNWDDDIIARMLNELRLGLKVANLTTQTNDARRQHLSHNFVKKLVLAIQGEMYDVSHAEDHDVTLKPVEQIVTV